MSRCLRIVLVLAALVLPNFLMAEECEDLKSASPTEAVNYLDDVQTKTVACVKAAFKQIEHLPSEDAIPILINHLGSVLSGRWL